MEEILKKIRDILNANVDEKTQKNAERFFKEEIRFYGVKTATVHKIAKESFKTAQDWSKAEVFAVCEQLWQSGIIEESFIACNWSYYLKKDYEPADFVIFEKWVDHYVSNWASCDTLCNHTLSAFLEMYPEFLRELKSWTKSKNRWKRRAAAVALVPSARRGKFLNEVLAIADQLLLDKDDLVQKGYGWMLKEASKVYQDEIYHYVMQHKAVMPRTALRYAIEKMPDHLRAVAMEK